MIVPGGLLLVKVDVLGQGLRKSHDLGCELAFIANQDLWQFNFESTNEIPKTGPEIGSKKGPKIRPK